MTEQPQPKAEPKNTARERLVEKYSKRWGVSPEEAERRIDKALEKRAVPGVDNIFPEPLGPVSEKAQDVNQAILSTQMTRRMLNTPPEDIAKLDQKIQMIGDMVDTLSTNFGAKIDLITSALEGKRAQEEREQLKSYLNDALAPLRTDLSTLKDKVAKEGTNIPQGAAMDLKSVLDNVQAATKNATDLLGFQGFKVEKESITKDDVSKMIDAAQKQVLENASPEELKTRVEAKGYKVVGGPITFDQAQQMVMESYKRGQEESMGQKQVDAVTRLIGDSVKNILDMFKPGVQAYLEGMFVDKGGQPSGQQPSQQPEPSSSGQGSQ